MPFFLYKKLIKKNVGCTTHLQPLPNLNLFLTVKEKNTVASRVLISRNYRLKMQDRQDGQCKNTDQVFCFSQSCSYTSLVIHLLKRYTMSSSVVQIQNTSMHFFFFLKKAHYIRSCLSVTPGLYEPFHCIHQFVSGTGESKRRRI